MLLSFWFRPLTHGSVGILDELLVYCLPLMVLVIILSIASRRARKRQPPRERTRIDRSPAADDQTSIE